MHGPGVGETPKRTNIINVQNEHLRPLENKRSVNVTFNVKNTLAKQRPYFVTISSKYSNQTLLLV